jgi:hypothetical protein
VIVSVTLSAIGLAALPRPTTLWASLLHITTLAMLRTALALRYGYYQPIGSLLATLLFALIGGVTLLLLIIEHDSRSSTREVDATSRQTPFTC